MGLIKQLDGDFFQDLLLLVLEAATLEREIARRRYGDPEGERGGGTRRLLNGFAILLWRKKNGDGGTVFRWEAAIRKRYANSQKN